MSKSPFLFVFLHFLFLFSIFASINKNYMAQIVSPSLLSANFGNLQEDLKMINKSECDWLHIDIMDGVFVPNLSFGPPVLKYVSELCEKPLDVHLMVVNVTPKALHIRQAQ